MPLILSGQYAAAPYRLVSAFLFFLVVVPLAYLLARLRLQSGSIWPMIVARGAWNAVIVSTFGAFTAGSMAGLWAGESGILTALATVIVVALLVRGEWTMRKAPGDAPFAEKRVAAV